MAIFGLPTNLGSLQGVALGAPYLFPFGSDQPNVGMLDNTTGGPAFADAKIMSIDVKPENTIFQHPLETGANIMDHYVQQPLEATVSMILEKEVYRDVYSSLKSYFQQAKLLIIQTRTETLMNMVLVTIPHEENAEMFDAIPVTLTLRQLNFVSPSQGTTTVANVASPNDSNTINQGMRTPSVTAVNTDAFQQVNAAAQQGYPIPRVPQ